MVTKLHKVKMDLKLSAVPLYKPQHSLVLLFGVYCARSL